MTTALAPRKEQLESVKVTLDKMNPQFRVALPMQIPVERFLRVALNALQNKPELLDCDRNSFYRALLTAAQLGLEPDGVLGQGWLVPFKQKGTSTKRVQFIPGYRGLILLARNSGEMAGAPVEARAVFEGDVFEYEYGLHPRVAHTPRAAPDKQTKAEMTHVYAIARYKDASVIFEVMTKRQVEDIRARAPGGEGDAWTNHYVEMSKKTAIRRIAKWLPLTVQAAAALEDAHDRGVVANLDKGDLVIDVEPPSDEPPAAQPQTPAATGALDKFAAGEALPPKAGA